MDFGGLPCLATAAANSSGDRPGAFGMGDSKRSKNFPRLASGSPSCMFAAGGVVSAAEPVGEATGCFTASACAVVPTATGTDVSEGAAGAAVSFVLGASGSDFSDFSVGVGVSSALASCTVPGGGGGCSTASACAVAVAPSVPGTCVSAAGAVASFVLGASSVGEAVGCFTASACDVAPSVPGTSVSEGAAGAVVSFVLGACGSDFSDFSVGVGVSSALASCTFPGGGGGCSTAFACAVAVAPSVPGTCVSAAGAVVSFVLGASSVGEAVGCFTASACAVAPSVTGTCVPEGAVGVLAASATRFANTCWGSQEIPLVWVKSRKSSSSSGVSPSASPHVLAKSSSTECSSSM